MQTALEDKVSDEEKSKRTLERIRAELDRVRHYTPKVGVFGDTGVGKSSLCNAIFGSDIAKISDVEACTREPQEILIGGEGKGGIVLLDVPGVGEDPERHDEYIELYKSLLPNLDLVLWAIKADDRKYASALNVYNEILEPNIESCPVVFVITQSDKIEPYREWDIVKSRPGETQLANLQRKVNDVSSRFDVSTNKIVCVASSEGYNLVELVNKVVEVLPNEKKYSFTREAKEENVSEEAALSAETGILEHVKRIAGEIWEFIQPQAVTLVVAGAKKYVPKLAKLVVSWLSKWL